MQSVKYVMREVLGSAAELEDHLEYNYLSNGYKMFSQHVEPIHEGSVFKGYRILVTLVKDEPEPVEVKSKKL